MNDPYEPLNRGIWNVNKGLLVGVIQPAGRAYRAVVRPPVRNSITNFTRNATYPGRLINNSLQGRWKGAGDESLRFLTNTTVGIAGFFDVASKWNIPKSNADFGQTFSSWGWTPGTYLMLPGVGPSDEMHAVGVGADELVKPWNYDYPYTIAAYGTAFNTMAENSEDAATLARSEADPYAGIKYIWSYSSKESQPDWQMHEAPDPTTLQTFGVATIHTRDPEFAQLGQEMTVRLPSTGKSVKFNCWLQKDRAPIAYITPGLGTHREAQVSLSLAEHLYQNGFSVVSTTGTFHPEFMERISTAALPGYPPVDSHDLLVSLTEMDRALEQKYPDRLGKRALVGCSMGGFHTLYLAAREKKTDPGLIRFDRYVAIDTPVNLYHGIKNIDTLFAAPNAWPAGQRQALMNNAVHKAAKLATLPPAAATGVPPFGAVESKYLVGLSFRLTLRDTIFSSQSRNNMGVLQTPVSNWRREPVYEEIYSFSFRDYFDRFAVPYYRTRGVTSKDFIREVNLENSTASLSSQQKVRVLVNGNDFLFGAGDLSWLRSTFGSSRLTVFPSGGHLGNLGTAPVQSAILTSLDGLK
jgi:ABC-type transporter lipoprotein component MlaA/pimeloyl-ACP methyl ester carboxylesterase